MWALWLARDGFYWSSTAHPREPRFVQCNCARGPPWANQKHPANQNHPCQKAAPIASVLTYVYFSLILSASWFKTTTTRFCVFAGCHDDVVKIVELACKHNVCLIPYGGELDTHLASKQNKLLHTVQAVVYLDFTLLPEVMRCYN